MAATNYARRCAGPPTCPFRVIAGGRPATERLRKLLYLRALKRELRAVRRELTTQEVCI
jgi:hypothetical protein